MSLFYHKHESEGSGFKRITMFEGSKCFWHLHQPTVLDILISLYENELVQSKRFVDVVAHDPLKDLESNRIFLNYDNVLKFSGGSLLTAERKETYVLPKVISFTATHEVDLETCQKIVSFILHHVTVEFELEDLCISLNKNLAPADVERVVLKNKPSSIPTVKLSHSKVYIPMNEMKVLVQRMYRHHLGPSFYFGCDLSISTDFSSSSTSSSPSSYTSNGTTIESKSSCVSSVNSEHALPLVSPPPSMKSILKHPPTSRLTPLPARAANNKEDGKSLPPLPSSRGNEADTSSKQVSPIFPDVRFSPRFEKNHSNEEAQFKYLLLKKSFDDIHLLENTRTPCNSFAFPNPQPEGVFFDSEKIYELAEKMKNDHHHHHHHSDAQYHSLNKKDHENHLPGLKFVPFGNVPAEKILVEANDGTA